MHTNLTSQQCWRSLPLIQNLFRILCLFNFNKNKNLNGCTKSYIGSTRQISLLNIIPNDTILFHILFLSQFRLVSEVYLKLKKSYKIFIHLYFTITSYSTLVFYSECTTFIQCFHIVF